MLILVGMVMAFGSRVEAGETYFNDDGVAFYAFETRGYGFQPLWRLLDNKKIHVFTSNDALKRRLMDSAGAVLEPSGIYLSGKKLAGMVPLYEFKRLEDSRTVLVVGEEGRADLKARPKAFEEIPQKSWVYPPEINPSLIETNPVPVRLLRNPFTDVRLYLVSEAEIKDLLAKRQLRLDRILKSARRTVKNAKVRKVVPVGRMGELLALSWHFERSDNIGDEVELGDGKTQKTRGEFVSFDVIVMNNGAAPVTLQVPVVLTGKGVTVPPSTAATKAYVAAELRWDPDKKLGSGERKRFQFVYDLPPRARDVVLIIKSGEETVADVIVLDTGR